MKLVSCEHATSLYQDSLISTLEATQAKMSLFLKVFYGKEPLEKSQFVKLNNIIKLLISKITYKFHATFLHRVVIKLACVAGV